jgi:hypothetical protein
MTTGWVQQITEVEERARDVNLALGHLCAVAGVAASNLSRWKQGGSPSLRVFLRDLSKLQSTLRQVEYEMAMKLIDRINPTAAPRIAELLKSPNAGAPGDHLSYPEQKRDGRESTDPEQDWCSPALVNSSERAA